MKKNKYLKSNNQSKSKKRIKNLSIFLAINILLNGYVLEKAASLEQNDELLQYELIDECDNNNNNSNILVDENYEYQAEDNIVTLNQVIDNEIEEINDNKETNDIEYNSNIQTNNYVEEKLCSEETSSIIENQNQVELGIIDTDTYLYATPSDYALDIIELKLYDNVYRIFSTSSGYDLVRTSNNMVGFVKSSDIYYTGLDGTYSYNIKDSSDLAITTNEVDLKLEPIEESYTIRVIQKNMELFVVGSVNDEWLLVHLNGEVGFIPKESTYSIKDKINEQYPGIINENLTINKLVVVDRYTKLTTQPQEDSNVVKYFGKSETLRVLSEIDNWYFGINDDYEIGFVPKTATTEISGKKINTDISTQRMWMYNENQIWFYTRVKTGKNETPTEVGTFEIYYMGEKQEILKDVVVDYEMAYNGAELIHDYQKCTVYGEQDYTYAGSNGCTRTPLENVAKIYKKACLGLPVIVHK